MSSYSFIKDLVKNHEQDKDGEPGQFTTNAIDSNIDESLKQIKSNCEIDVDFIEDAPELQKKIFNEDDTLLFARALQMARTHINLDRLSQVIYHTYHSLSWDKFVEIELNDALLSKIKNKLRSVNNTRATAGEEYHSKHYTSAWYNDAEERIKNGIEEARRSGQGLALATPNLAGSARRLRYTDAEEAMFKHWMIQGKRRNYIFSAYRKTRSKESIIHKMKSVRKSFSSPPATEGKEHVKMYTENDKGHFDGDAPGFCAEGPIPEADIEAFQERINELVKTRTLINDEDDDDPYKSSRSGTSIDLNLLRNYILLSDKVQTEFAKVERHVGTADPSWVQAAQAVQNARGAVDNALNLTKHRAGHELDGLITAEELAALLGHPGHGHAQALIGSTDLETDAIVSMIQQQQQQQHEHEQQQQVEIQHEIQQEQPRPRARKRRKHNP